jgi:hypothetical protein
MWAGDCDKADVVATSSPEPKMTVNLVRLNVVLAFGSD